MIKKIINSNGNLNKLFQLIFKNQKISIVNIGDGEKIEIDGIFIAEGIAGGSNFAKKLGIITKGDNIDVNENMQTNIPGIFACGDLTGGLYQINKSVYEGAKAGLQAVKYLKEVKE